MQSRRRLLSTLLSAPLAYRARAANGSRPNIVFVLADDVRWDDLRCMGHPFARTHNIDRVAEEGALFRNAFVTTPLCSPSRASFLTGLYAHSHGITDNTDRSARSHQLPTFPRALQRAGYETGYIGKWHMGNDDTKRPGFDYWVSFKGQGDYHNPELNENGKTARISGYVTDIFTDRAVSFLERDRRKPFFLYLAHKAVHPNAIQRDDGSIVVPPGGGFDPAERHKSMYEGQRITRRASAASGAEGKPALMRKIGDLPPLGPETGTDDETIRNRLRMLMAVDDGVGRMLQALERKGLLDDTVFIFTSDNGYFYGEHGLSVERRLAYEESARIPLLVRYPRLIKPGTTPDQFALNIDIAPTLVELAGAEAMNPVHGRSLVPVLRGNARRWRTSFLIEYFSDRVFPRMVNMGYQAVRNRRWKYIRYTELSGTEELYDLQSDPYEMKNLIEEPGAERALKEMQRELERLLKETGASASG